jgi:hypothetical protein
MKAQQRLFLTVMIFMACLSAPLFAQGPQDAQYSQDQGGGDPPGRVARLGYISGSVSFQPSGQDQWSQALANYPLTTGDRIYTDRDGRAELETGNIAVRLSSGTDLAATNLNDQLVQLDLTQGTLRVRAYQILDGNSVEIDTPNAALTLLRPGSYRVETYPDDNTTLVTVDSGDLEINGNNFSQVVHSGQSLKLSGADDVQVSWLQPQGGDDFDRWCGDRDRRFTSSNSRQYVGQYVPGSEDLDQYGQWEPAQDYGQVWYPSAVPAGWAPYRYGRWAWVQPWGWTWVEDEPWGFAPFHYGRWALIGARWGWVPGSIVVGVRPVYAPALVAFVGGPNANVQVWFPLGPRDPYLPWYHHSDGYLRQVNVTNVRTQVNIVNVINVRNENNFHYAYQRIAPTAVSTEAFRGSRPVAREIVHVDAEAIGRQRVIRPEIRPDARAIHAGAVEAHPPVERTRPRIETRAPVNANGAGRPQGNNPRGGQPQQPQVNGRAPGNDRPQGNDRTPGNRSGGQQEQTLPAQVQRTPPPGGAPITDVNRNDANRNAPSNNPPRENIHAGPPADNRDGNRGNAPAENTRPAQVPRTPPPGQAPTTDVNRNAPPPRDNIHAAPSSDNRDGNRGNVPAENTRPAQVPRTPPPGQAPTTDVNRNAPPNNSPQENIHAGPPADNRDGNRGNAPVENTRPAQVPRTPPPSAQNPPAVDTNRNGNGRDNPVRENSNGNANNGDNNRGRGQSARPPQDSGGPPANRRDAAPPPQPQRQQPPPKAQNPPPKEDHGKDKDKDKDKPKN